MRYRSRHFVRGTESETNNEAQNFYHKVPIIHYSKNYCGLTLETKFKAELSMGDIPCLFFSRKFVPLMHKLKRKKKLCFNEKLGNVIKRQQSLSCRGIGAHVFSPGTSWDEALGQSYCCDFGSLLLPLV